ncbi:MAG TPA: hypothetical protein DDW23_07700 [Planctomycetes bacterium]|nr:hypothetical protein [Planctomycetota bacterium]
MLRKAHISLLALLLITPGCFGGGIGLPEIAVVGVLLLLFFGADKLPRLMRGMGSGITEFKKGLKDGEKMSDEDGPEDSPPEDGADVEQADGDEKAE